MASANSPTYTHLHAVYASSIVKAVVAAAAAAEEPKTITVAAKETATAADDFGLMVAPDIY